MFKFHCYYYSCINRDYHYTSRSNLNKQRFHVFACLLFTKTVKTSTTGFILPSHHNILECIIAIIFEVQGLQAIVILSASTNTVILWSSNWDSKYKSVYLHQSVGRDVVNHLVKLMWFRLSSTRAHQLKINNK